MTKTLRKLLASLGNNQFLRPIITSLNRRELLLFLILLGLLPSIADFSLFYISGISALDFLFENPLAYTGFNTLLTSLLITGIGTYLILIDKKYLYFFAISPSIFLVLFYLIDIIDFGNIAFYAVLSSILSKIAFVIFIMKGKLRSLSFLLFCGILFFVTYESNQQLEMTFLQSIKQATLFIFFTLVCRFIFLWFQQNIKTFATVKRSRLGLLLLKSVVLWSPILLFAIPQQYITQRLEQYGIDKIYAIKGMQRHYMDTKLTVEDLMHYDVPKVITTYKKDYAFYTSDSLQKKQEYRYKFIEKKKRPEDTTLLRLATQEPYVRFNTGTYFQGYTDLQTKQANLIKALVYVDQKLLKNDSILKERRYDFIKVSNQFKHTYRLLQQTYCDTLDKTDYFISAIVASKLKKIVVQKRFPGKSGLEIDAILSVHTMLSGEQAMANRKMDSANESRNKQFNKSRYQAENELATFVSNTDALANDVSNGTITTKTQLINRTNTLNETFKDSLAERTSRLKSESQAFMKSAPQNARNTLDDNLKKELEHYISYFAPKDCYDPEEMDWYDFLIDPEEILLWIGCRIEEMAKKSQRNAYKEFRSNALDEVEMRTAKLFDASTQNNVLGRMDAIEAETNALTDGLANNINTATSDASEKLDSVTRVSSAAVIRESSQRGKVVIEKMQVLQDSVNAYDARVKNELNEQFEQMKLLSANSITAVNRAIETNKLFGQLLLVLLIFKSFFYVFARVSFNEDEDLHVTVSEAPKDFKNGTIRNCGIEYSIPADHKETFFISRKYRPTGRAPKVGIHCWTASFFRRIRTNTYLMNHVSINRKSEESIDFRSLAGAEFVEWTLSDGEEVVFDYNHLVALTGNIKLSTEISLRLTSTLFAQTFFPVAKGPGKLVLMTKGQPLADDEETGKSVHIDRLIAWQKTTKFAVISELNLVDLYLSGLYLKRSSTDMVLIDADETAKKRKVGIARFISKFFLPT
ncbi:AIM24 family protein [uncultured Altibacter sp.]|uniref:AIM24 family protein n=1 Tax=uncultured Altibacter sp. TaxID=2506933 RepID=UPI0030DC9B5A